MKITNETVYDWGAYVAMNRMVTRATHRGQSIALRVLFAALALLLLFAARFQFTGILQVLLALLGAVILLWTLFLNQLRALLMVKLIMKGVKVFTNTFDQEGWTVAGVGGGEQRMSYDDIASILEGAPLLHPPGGQPPGLYSGQEDLRQRRAGAIPFPDPEQNKKDH